MKGLPAALLILACLAAACVIERNVEPLPRLESGCYRYVWEVVSDACWPDGLPAHPFIEMQVTLSSGGVAVETDPIWQPLVPSLAGTHEGQSFTATGNYVYVVSSDCSLSVTDVLTAEAVPDRYGEPVLAAALDVEFDGNLLNGLGVASHCEAQAGQLYIPGVPELVFPTLSDPVAGSCVTRIHGHAFACGG